MKALLSGEAGIAVILEGTRQIRAFDGDVRCLDHNWDVFRLFEGCCDVKQIEAKNVEEIDQLVAKAWAADRGLKLFLLLLDPESPTEDLEDLALCINDLLNDLDVLRSLESRLYSATLPIPIEVNRIQDACRSSQRTSELFSGFLQAQNVVNSVRASFEKLVEADLVGTTKAAFRESLIQQGAFSDVVKALCQNADLGFLKLLISSRHRANQSAIATWLRSLQSDLKKSSKSDFVDFDVEEDEEQDGNENRYKGASYAAFEQIKAQQRTISEKLKANDISTARWLTDELIKSQSYNSTREQIAKSLCSLAQKAKLYGVISLQLEWAKEATSYNPLDPMTFGHLADAYLSTHEYLEATQAFDRVEQAGGACFAATGRGRVLRAMGRFDEARDAFLEAARTFEGEEGVEYALFGAAEILRDIGDFDRALNEYKHLVEKYPSEAVAWAGLASTQMDLGRLDEAMLNFGRAGANDPDSAVSQNGRATAAKIAGKFAEAVELYDEILIEYPNDQAAFCGRAEVFRASGQLELALKQYDEAISRFPYSPIPLSGKASVLRELERFDEAEAIYLLGETKFKFDRSMTVGNISVLRAKGLYAEALQKLDLLISEFPQDLRLHSLRAGLIQRLGQDEEALKIYNDIISQRPSLINAVLSKAALLLRLNKTDEAEKLLGSNIKLQTQSDWKRYILSSFIIQNKSGHEAAVQRLLQGMRSCPFAFERKRMRNALATLQLARGKRAEALRIFEDQPSEISNIVALHVLAANKRGGQARFKLDAIISSPASPAEIIDLAQEIAKRHGVLDVKPAHNTLWIILKERELLLLEAV